MVTLESWVFSMDRALCDLFSARSSEVDLECLESL